MITALIFLVLHMHIKPIRIFEDAAPNTEIDAKWRIRPKSTSLDWNDSNEIKKVIVVDKNDEDVEDPQEMNTQQNRGNQY